MKKGYVSLIIHSSAGHFWGRRAGHGIPDLKTQLENYFDFPLRCLACGRHIPRGLVVGVKGERWHGMALYTAICKHLTSLIRYPQLASLSSSPITMDSLAVAHTAKARVVTDIIKSQNDDRSHRGLVLDNGLKVGTERV